MDMPDFERSIEVAAPKQKVIDYVSRVENMPSYLPTVKEARMDGKDRVHMAVEINGEHHEDGGFFRAKEDRLEWGSEDHDYNGSMTFSGEKDLTSVSIQLHINPPEDLSDRMDENSGGDWTSRIEQGIEGALTSIKTQVESQSGHQ